MTGEPKAGVEITQQQWQSIGSLFDKLPESYDERVVAMQSLRRAFYAELAKHLQPTLNVYAKAQPQDTWEERKALASWINHTLRHLGLALVAPRTNEPAILIADVTGIGPKQRMRFRFETRDRLGKRVRASVSDELPDLELMQSPPRVENLSKEYKGQETGPQLR